MSGDKRSSNKQVFVNASEAEVETWSELSKPEDSGGEDELHIASLRPDVFSEYVGQDSIKENLLIACQAASKRGESLDHVLLHGPPGLGKTSLARIVAREMNVGFKSTSGPVMERSGDLAAILSSLEARDVLFIDEIHRLPRVVEEVLYPAMEDFQIDILIGQGPAARAVKIPLKPFTLIGATTRTSLLTSPLRDRFGMCFRLGFYSSEELQQIVIRSAAILQLPLEADCALEIGRRSRGTPRIANRMLKRVRDYAQERCGGKLDLSVARKALELLEVDELGLDKMDRLILEIMIDKFSGGPVGIDTLSVALGEDAQTIEDVYEPFLVQAGLLVRTRRGREATVSAYQHLGREPGKQANQIGFRW